MPLYSCLHVTGDEAEGLQGGEAGLGNEHEALAAKLLEGGAEKLDSATIAAAAAGLRDTSVLEKQLKRARDVSSCASFAVGRQKEHQQLHGRCILSL